MLLLLALSCSQPTPAPAPTTPTPTATAPATPVTLTVIAPADTPVDLETTWGSLTWLHVADLGGELGFVGLHQPDPSCPCECSPDSRCPECEPPMHTITRVMPGVPRDFAWDGQLARHRLDVDGDWCTEPLVPPAGRYRLATCDVSGEHCAHTDVDLPGADPVVLALAGPRPELGTCPTGMERRLAAEHRERLVSGGIVAERITPCSAERVVCAEPSRLEEGLDAARDQACTLWVIPRGAKVEVLAFAPLPAGTVGGERYSAFVDPWGTEVLRVRYTQ